MNTPPGPKGHPILGQALEFQSDPITLLNHLKTYGDVVSFRLGPLNMCYIAHPDYVKQILVDEASKFEKGWFFRTLAGKFLGNGLITSGGDFWKRQRKLVQPAFHAKRIEAYLQTMVEHSTRLSRTWKDGESYDIDRDMMRLALGITVKTLFNTDAIDDSDDVYRAMVLFQETTGGAPPLLPDWIPTTRNRKKRRSIKIVDTILTRIINERRAANVDTGDLLSMLLMAQDDEGQHMTTAQLYDEVRTLFIAGHETTAAALAWSYYMLSQNPEVEAKLHDEVDTVLQGRPITIQDLSKLKYTEMVIKETMRLYPPAWQFFRAPLEDVKFGDFTVRKGTTLFLSPYMMQHDGRWWDDVETFRPERFADENREQTAKYAYFPFGGGPRVCMGNSFAMMEAKVVLATIAQSHSLQVTPGHKVGMKFMGTIRTEDGMYMTVQPRTLPVPVERSA